MNIPVDISAVTLKTKRLKLRQWQTSDLQDFYEYASVDGVGQMAGWAPHQNIEESRTILEMFIAGKKTFALEYEGKVIGSLGIERYDEERFPALADSRCREIGYVLSKEYWGKGLMPEAVRAVIDYLFETLQADCLLCGHFLSNSQSLRVQQKCGFSHYSFGEFETRLGTVEKDEMNILTKEDWQRKREEKLNGLQIVSLREKKELSGAASEWFSRQWGVPSEEYLLRIMDYIDERTEYGWYVCLDGETIVAGLGVIDNDFHERKDLTPNICAVKTEEAYRDRGIAGLLLDRAVHDLKETGISPVYLLTDHIGFYERYGWEFLEMVQGADDALSRMYIHY